MSAVAVALSRASPWAEAVLHVLAHVDVGRVAASCHDPRWVAWAEERFGPALERPLGEDARVLASALRDHDVLARAHALVWTFGAESRVLAAMERDLVELGAADVDDTEALALTRDLGPPAEILRAAAELEMPLIVSLGEASVDLGALGRALGEVARAAPELARVRVEIARPLPRRGRAFGSSVPGALRAVGRLRRTSVLVGAPGVAGAELDHVAWQAAHEATVVEVHRLRQATKFADVERRALGLLRSRAGAAGLAEGHAAWLATLDLGPLLGGAPIPDVDDLSH